MSYDYPRHSFHLPGWPDTVEGLYALKKQVIITTLSNGNVRLLIDMVCISMNLGGPVD